MPRYIDAEEAKKAWYIELGITSKRAAIGVDMVFDRIPTADVEEVRHGKWKEIIDEKEDLFFRQKFYCSACGEWNTYGMTAYCPKCGARMDGKNGKD
jgi:hypothetical protein